MRTRFQIWILLLAAGLSACSPSTALNITTPTILPPTAAPTATATSQPTSTASPTPAASPTAQANCTESALFLADVTVQDGENIPAGQPFTKTWRLRNNGTCTWNSGYRLVFVSGERLSSPDSIPLSETLPGKELELSIELSASSIDGNFAAFYEIRNPAGKTVPVGLLTNIWVKIRVGTSASAPPAAAAPPVNPAATAQPTSVVCNPGMDGAAAAQIVALINTARAENGLSALGQNDKLDSAARRHSTDMACNNLRGHTGSDGSSVGQRVAEAGYASSGSEEIIYVGGGAEAALSWWLNDQVHRDAILRAEHRHIGVSVSSLPGSAYGTYISVVLAAP